MANPTSLAIRLERNPVKINKWNGQEVRVALDDLVTKYLVEEARYVEDHSLLNQKLLIVLLMNLVGAATSLYAYLVPFAASKLLTGIGAASYLAILAFYSFWLGFLITPTFFRGALSTTAGRSRRLWLCSKLRLPQAIYTLTIINPSGQKAFSGAKEHTWEIGNWINEDGVVDGAIFCADMQKFVTLLSSTKSE